MRSLTLTIVAMTSLLAAAPAGGHGPTRAPGDPHKAVRDLVHRNSGALVGGDLHALEEVWAQDDVALYEDEIARHGWREVANHTLRRKLDGRSLLDLRVSNIKTHITRRAAWSTFMVDLTEETPDGRRRASGVGSAILELRGADWKLLHWHVSTTDRSPTKGATP